ncbi:hypothetical protein GCM10011428_55370 [Streptomyces violaceus]
MLARGQREGVPALAGEPRAGAADLTRDDEVAAQVAGAVPRSSSSSRKPRSRTPSWATASNSWPPASGTRLWHKAHNDQKPDPALSAEVDRLIGHGNLLKKALDRHNWRNVSAVLAAFQHAGLAGSTDVAAFYAHVDHLPPSS